MLHWLLDGGMRGLAQMKKGCRQMVEGQAGGAVMRRMFMGGLVFAVALAAFGRGEPWVPPPHALRTARPMSIR